MFNLGLFQKQTTHLVMTTELRQAITLLQYSTTELAQFIQEQALENPLIELEEPMTVSENFYVPRKKRKRKNNDVEPFSLPIPENQSLQECLLQQAGFLQLSHVDRKVLEFLIGNVDDRGFLTMEVEEVAELLDVELAVVENNVKTLQSFEPAGVGARNVQESLLVQLHRHFPNEHIAIKIVHHYFQWLLQQKWKEISEALQVSLDDVKEAVTCIQLLHPYPGSAFDSSDTVYLIPDIIISKEFNNYHITLNESLLPTIHLHHDYQGLLRQEHPDYYREKYHHYQWLLRSLEQRRQTLINITTMIIEEQREFLEGGFFYLKPMTLKEIADHIGVHESTVSRAVKNKIIQTPVGIFEMNRLFTSKIKRENGEDTSSTKVKLLIEQVIASENKEKPFSDQKIADYLQEHYQLAISRRTVTKYRQELGYLAASKRKVI